MGNAAGSAEISQGREIKEITKTSLEHTGLQRQMSVPKLPMPPENELEECFNAALNTMNLPPDKVLILSQYDNEKKWELICDQKQFQVKNPPSTYLEKLKGCLDHGGVGRKFKRRVQEVTPVLRELEISLRTNHIGWAQEFLNEENQGLIVLVNYLSAAQSAVTCESETSENGALSSEKGKATDKLTEDQGSGSRDSPTNLGPKLSHGLTIKRAQRPSHIVQKDDIHLCIMCLRVIMNYQSGFNQVMKHPSCVNEIALSLNNRNPRTKALVLELLAAVCLVRGGHDITLSAFDNFKEVCGEKRRFEKLMEYFRKEESHINFTVACMQFINIVVHSVENLNFRVYLQYEFTQHGLDDYLDLLKFTESDRLLVQIQAYLDNVFDVAALLEDAETKNRLLEHIEQLQKLNTQLCSTLHETETGAVQNVIEVEKKIIQTRNDEDPLKLDQSRGENGCSVDLKELKLGVHALVEQGLLRLERSPSGQLVLQVVQQGPQTETVTDEKDADRTSSAFPTAAPEKLQPPPPPPPPPIGAAVQQTVEGLGNKQKKPIQTKYRMPLFNWDALKSDQVEGTIFSELDEQHVLQELDMEAFEEQFKTKGQSPPVDLWTLKKKTAHKTQSRVSLMEPNRAKNLAITLHKECLAVSDICSAIKTYNQEALSLDFLELLERFIPTEYEMKGIQTYESEGRPLGELSKEDLFMVQFGKIPRLSQRISTLTFMGNFPESVQNIQPHLNSIIAASMSVRTSVKLKKILEIILAFGNYMNSSKRGPAYGFRIQSLDLLPETKSTDRRRTLLHFIVGIIQEKYPELENFDTELHFLDKAVLVSFESILRDLGALEKGMELTRTEFSEEENAVLKTFLNTNAQVLDSLTADGKSAQDAYKSVVEYFGEDPKTTPPSNFFPIFIRFIKAYKQAEQDRSREQHREKKGPTCDDQSSSPKPEPPRNKVPAMYRQPHMDIIAELKRKQGSSLVREGQDGTIEDIITKLNDQPYRRTDATRHSAKEKPGQMLQVSSDISL